MERGEIGILKRPQFRFVIAARQHRLEQIEGAIELADQTIKTADVVLRHDIVAIYRERPVGPFFCPGGFSQNG